MAPQYDSPTNLSEYWWETQKSDVNNILFSVVRFLRQQNGARRATNIQNMRLFGNMQVLGLTAYSYAQSNSYSSVSNRVSYNIVKSMCDTVTNKTAKNKLKPTFLTEDGDYSLQQKAKKLDKFVQGQFYQTKMSEKAPKVFLDSTIFDAGVLHVYHNNKDICTERCFVEEFEVDEADAIYGDPRSLFRLKSMPKEVMVKMFPKFKDKIMSAKRAENPFPLHQSLSNQIEVIEAWHLPSPDYTAEDGIGNDGRHCIVIENAVLIDEPWEKKYFPFVFLKWTEPVLGFWGKSLAEELTGLQIEINKILRNIQISFHLLGTPTYLVDVGSKIVKAHMNNEIGKILEYSGIKPELYTPNPVNAQLFAHLETLVSKAYQIAGVSEMSAMSQKPAGLNSGKALRAFNDIESERFVLNGQKYEAFHLEVASQMLDLAKELSEINPEYSVLVHNNRYIEHIQWSDVNMEKDKYVLKMFPTSSLSQTPAGRLQDVQELIQAGFIDKNYALQLLDFPDLQQYMSLESSAIDDINKQIELMSEKGEYMPPEPYQNLSLGLKMIQAAYLKARNQNLPEENLELLRRWMEEAKRLMDQAAASQMQAQMPQGGPEGQPQMPQGQPVASPQGNPTSDILPMRQTG